MESQLLDLLRNLGTEVFSFITCVVCLVIVLVRRRRHPRVSAIAAIALVLLILQWLFFSIADVWAFDLTRGQYHSIDRFYQIWALLKSFLFAFTLGLLLLAIFIDRRVPVRHGL